MNPADPCSSSSQPLAIRSEVSLYESEEFEQEMIIAEEIVLCSESEDLASDASFCSSDVSQDVNSELNYYINRFTKSYGISWSCPKPV